MTEDTTSAAIGGDPLFDGAEGDNGLWIVWSVDEATGKCASIIGYMWSEEYSAGKLHEYFIFDDNVFNPDYEKLPFVKTLTFWRMSPQPKIASKGEFETWVTTSAPQKIDTPDQVKRFADTAVDSKGWPT